MTHLTDRMVRELAIPSTPSELAIQLEAPLRTVRALLYQLREQGLVYRTNKSLKNNPGHQGRPEYLWRRV